MKSTLTRCLPVGQWVREACSAHGRAGENLSVEMHQ